MAIDAATLANYIMLSANSDGGLSGVVAGDSAFGDIFTEALNDEALTTLTQSAAASTGETGSDTADNIMNLLYLIMGSGIGGDGLFENETLYALAESLGSALYGNASTPVTNEQANNLYQLFANKSAGTTAVAESTGGNAVTPVAASVAATPSVVSTTGNRSAELYNEVIDQFNVETNPRYEVNKNGENDTYCNIFMWDVTSAMGAEIPHYVDPETLEPMYYPDVEGAQEMNANAIYNWLGEVGEEYGWYQVTAEQAQNLANEGHPAVTARYNSGGHGHVQVVCPSEDGTYDAGRGVAVAQAGLRLRRYAYMNDLYKNSDDVVYYAHA